MGVTASVAFNHFILVGTWEESRVLFHHVSVCASAVCASMTEVTLTSETTFTHVQIPSASSD